MWNTCPWICGGYSYATPECDRLNLEPSMLNMPVLVNGIPRIVFAGEALHPTNFSTTHGAFESGQDQANFLTNYF